MANMMEFNGENKFKVNAYRNGANILRSVEEDFDDLVKTKSLGNIKGIGKGLQSLIYEYWETGKSTEYDELIKSVPSGIEELFLVRGLGAKKIKTLYDELDIKNIGELEYACKENRLALLKGFGNKTQEKIIAEIDKLKIYSKFVLLHQANKYYNEIAENLSGIKSVIKFEKTGELRRSLEIISSLEFVLLIYDKKKFKVELKKYYDLIEEENKLVLKVDYPIPCVLHLSLKEEEYCSTIFSTTGSDEFLKQIIYKPDKHTGNNEEEIFKLLNMNFIIPEMREEPYFKQKNKKLLVNSDLGFSEFIGALHFHTTASDGRNSLKQMIDTAQKLGFEYAAVCDHSKSAFYANGLTEERVLKQKDEIKKLSMDMNFPILQGIESDILGDGKLDYDNKFMNNFDFVVASVHSQFNMNESEMTKRMIKAVENPHTNLLGHPSGRLLLSREPYKLDIQKVIDACAANKVAIEINANPHRLDLDWRWIYYARDKGCLFSINPDAHSIEDILYTNYGIGVARKGGLMKSEVINCFELNLFKKFISKK